MAAQTGIAWTDGTINFWIGCTHCGPGCGEQDMHGEWEGCYAADVAWRRWKIKFGHGEHRHKTKVGYENPLSWQRQHDQFAMGVRRYPGNVPMMKEGGKIIPVPLWVFCNSLSDFFDNEIDPEWRNEAWAVIRRCPSLRWQIVTKRIGNVPKMLPDDWHDGANYQHVGIISTMVTQTEYDRDAGKLHALYDLGVKWTGISCEPQLGPVKIAYHTDWVISGGESKQGHHAAREYNLEWPRSLRDQCAERSIPFFEKQFGDNPEPPRGDKRGWGNGGKDPTMWPRDLQVQQMPRIYDDAPPSAGQGTLFGGAA